MCCQFLINLNEPLLNKIIFFKQLNLTHPKFLNNSVCVEHCMYRVSNRRLQWSVLFLLTADVVESEEDVMMVGQRGW